MWYTLGTQILLTVRIIRVNTRVVLENNPSHFHYKVGYVLREQCRPILLDDPKMSPTQRATFFIGFEKSFKN